MRPDLPALVIGGPTASGKTDVALQIAARVGGEIINADAFQLYKGLPLLTAQPSPEDLEKIPHQLVGEFSLAEPFDAARYLALARERIARAWEAGRPPILAGGTGLYIRTLLYGFTPGLPGPDPDLRARLETLPLSDLTGDLVERDPEARLGVDLQNPRRVIRALEVCILTGKPFTSFRDRAEWSGAPAGIWLRLEREVLHRKIELRAKRLFAEGVEAEVAGVRKDIGAGAKQALGFQEVCDVLDGRKTRQEAEQQLIASTRQYARRQETWFRKETSLLAVPPEEAIAQAELLIRRKRLPVG